MVQLIVVKLILLPLLFGWQVQGGPRQTIQVTQRASQIQPANIQLQADSESADRLQPALGWNVLDSSGKPIATLHR